GGWDQYSDKELASYLSSSSFTPARLRDQLATGELVLLKEIPAVPVFRRVSGTIVPAESASIAIAENAVTAFKTRFGDRQASPSRGTAYDQSDSLAPPARLDYTPEPPVIEPPSEPLPPPVVISENFGLPPLGPKVFAKSCTRPSGDTDSNEGPEKASNFGTVAMLAPATVTSPGTTGLRPLSLVSGSAMRLTNGWAMAARMGASVMSTAASTVLLAFWPSKLAFWVEVSADEGMRSQFSPANVNRMRKGRAPRAPMIHTVGGRRSFELHHLNEVRNGGGIYELDNLRVNTPKNHIHIHQG
ncbi:MAG TPA: hypothetical protein VKY53_06705, partial [Marinobacter sp.]|nr:hypothetical protein [Marinobacter sp.]